MSTERQQIHGSVMTRSDVATTLRVSVRTVDRYLEEGVLKRSPLPGRLVRILTSSVNALLEERAS